jgi:asparagine synthase (glutamine-hydrolysing)
MCGILVTASIRGRSPSASTADVTRMRDRLLTRGPDDEGLWSDGQVHIGHRRLAINRPTDNRQPLSLGETHRGEGPLVLAFNGELYECDALRAELERCGCRIRTGSDTELLAHAIAEWGVEAPRRVRGMFAFVAWRPRTQTLLMARDALGVIPLVYAIHGHEITIASEVRALLDHPAIAAEPDWHTVLHYLHSLKITQGSRTLFAGVHTVRPGEIMSVALDGEAPALRASTWWSAPREESDMSEDEASSLVREVVEHSIEAHLVSDVPLCTLLSGGLDSTIVSAVARRLHPSLQTFCAGAFPEDDGDCAVARRAAAALRTNHHTVGIRREDFLERWPAMVATLGVPLATPNEVAIHAVCRSHSSARKGHAERRGSGRTLRRIRSGARRVVAMD